MRINVYSQELTDEVKVIEKKSNTGIVYSGVQLILHSSDRLHHRAGDDDRSAVSFWLPKSPERREAFAKTLEAMAAAVRSAKPEDKMFRLSCEFVHVNDSMDAWTLYVYPLPVTREDAERITNDWRSRPNYRNVCMVAL